jgi:uncharacterized membrane protein (UPF0127 family)
MQKKAWPYTGSTKSEMGSMAPTGDPVKDINMDSSGRYDSLSATKSVIPDYQDPVTNTSNGIISNMTEPELYHNLSDDKTKPKECVICISNENDDPVAEFECDVAKDISEKVAGLQPYRELPDTAGLLFPYKRPTDVTYHMGSVSFPIDILFVDEYMRIKKIYKNIEPGSLATFGCAEVSNVLEIVGGLSDRLGISVGNKLDILSESSDVNKFNNKHGNKKHTIIKYSNIMGTKFLNWKNFPILNINNNIMSKSAKLNSSFIDSMKVNKDRYVIVYIDGLLKEAGDVNIFKRAKYDGAKPCFVELYGTATCIGEGRVSRYYDANISKDDVLLGGFKSLGSFIPATTESHHIFTQLNKFANDSSLSTKFILASELNPKNLKEFVSARIAAEFGPNKVIFKDIIKIDKGTEYKKISDYLSDYSFEKFGPNYILIGDNSLVSEGGSAIPQDVKEVAKKVYKIIEEAEIIIKDSVQNIMHNKTAYEKISSDFDKIAKSKGQYSESVKRQTRIVEKYLTKIRDSVIELNKIKDISTTMEIIDSLAEASKQSADIVGNIFDLIDYLDDPNFFQLLSDKTDQYDSACKDLLFTTDRAKEYINKHILGLTVLSK